MPLSLKGRISSPPTPGQQAMLETLQPNILKGHTREFLSVLFLRFTDAAAGRDFLGRVATLMKSAAKHLQEIAAFKKDKVPGTAYVGVGLTAEGYKALGLPKLPSDPSFNAGMQAADLHDPAVATWDPAFRNKKDLHACILIGDMTAETKSQMHDRVLAMLAAVPSVVVLGTQDGTALHNGNGDGIEHFGYVDGRSQPLFLDADVQAEQDTTDGTSVWNPAFDIGRVIVAEPGPAGAPEHFGSYFVFRKLEQDVRKFKQAELDFAEALGLADAERAGAMLVGRFEDGTPVTLQSQDGAHGPVMNDFNYASDRQGGKCPFLGHIRKTNPRGSGGFEKQDAERMHLMARRGQTYGVRADNPNDGEIANKPTRDVGLLFMAFNSDIANQFEFTQKNWANAAGFPKVDPQGGKAPGVDPVIGQTANDAKRPDMTVALTWGEPGSMKTVPAVPRAVTMKGGEYFFMPSLAFLRHLGAPAQNTAS